MSIEAESTNRLSPENWQQIKSIFQAAVDLDPSERSDFLDNVCSGDPSLRKKVESLISSDGQSWDLLERPALEVAAGLLTEAYPELSAGKALGSYKVLGLLGKGGMGEVYLAEDSRLRRKIALKVLPATLATSAGRIERFQQEAQAASALNHPNIVTIHEIGQAEGRHFIAIEFIEGETLRHRLKHSKLNVSEALDVAIQLAGALAAAHRAGVVHRDIKPENVMLRKDGYAKVLDFGLAKLIDQPSIKDAEEPDDMNLGSSSGLVMGTLRYMSPEQASGLEVDARSDIFSLGVVTYEMVTGRPPFAGETCSELIASILTVTPSPLKAFLPEAPDELGLLINKALSKEKEQRYQTITEMLTDLKDLKEKLDFESKGVRTPSEASGIFNGIGHRKRAAILISIVFTIMVGAISYLAYRGFERRAGEVPFQGATMTKLTTNGKSRDAAISPDGKYVAYVVDDADQESIWLQELATRSVAQVVAPAGVRYEALAFPPDSSSLYFVKNDEKGKFTKGLYQVSIFGGPAKKLIAGVHSLISFSPDGKQFTFFRRLGGAETALMIADVDGSNERELARRKVPEIFGGCPAWSPDGTIIACVVGRMKPLIVYDGVIEVRVENGAERSIGLVEGGWGGTFGLAWISDGSGLLLSGNQGRQEGGTQMWHISYPHGKIQPVTNYPVPITGVSLSSNANSLVTVRWEGRRSIWTVLLEDLTHSRQITPTGLSVGRVSWTPDNKIVFGVRVNDKLEVAIMEEDGTGLKQLTSGEYEYRMPVTSTDGQFIYFVTNVNFSSSDTGKPLLWRMDINGQNPKPLTTLFAAFPVISPDGQWVLYSSLEGEPLWYKSSLDGSIRIPLIKKPAGNPAISPDGKLVGCLYNDPQVEPPYGLALIPFEGGEPIKRIGLPLSAKPEIAWKNDDQSIVYIDVRGGVSNLWAQPISGAPPKQLTDFKFDLIYNVALSRDGKKIACVRGAPVYDVVLINR